MSRYVLNGSLRSNADLSSTLGAEIYSVCPTLPNFCPDCDYTHEKKLWFRRGAVMLCHRCGYQLKKNDYWLMEFEFEEN